MRMVVPLSYYGKSQRLKKGGCVKYNEAFEVSSNMVWLVQYGYCKESPSKFVMGYTE